MKCLRFIPHNGSVSVSAFPFEPLTFLVLVFQQLALYVLSFLEPKDLLQAAQTCRYWRILAEDNLLWREKCREEGEPQVFKADADRQTCSHPVGEVWSLHFRCGCTCFFQISFLIKAMSLSAKCASASLLIGIDEPLLLKKRKIVKPGFTHSPWKSAYIRQHRIDTNWRRGDLKSPKVDRYFALRAADLKNLISNDF